MNNDPDPTKLIEAAREALAHGRLYAARTALVSMAVSGGLSEAQAAAADGLASRLQTTLDAVNAQ
jgi:hypothetical protein